MIVRLHPSKQFAASLLRAVRASLLALALAGCRHKGPLLALPPISTAPVALEVPPESDDPAIIEAPSDAADITPPPVSEQQQPRPVARKRATPPPKDPPPAVQVASTDSAELAIGALSTGGGATLQGQQLARDLIGSVQKRLAALSSKMLGQQKSQIKQLNRFLKQAEEALTSGDADGAKNLATKAALMMDEIEKTN